MAYYQEWKPYVPVAKRRAQATKQMAALRKKGVDIQPIQIEGRKIAQAFWSRAWCDHLESFSDFDNRLPRGRTYVRNGSVCHLGINKGKIEAKVSGSKIYNIKVTIKTLPARKWEAIKKQCSGKIGSLLELLKGDLADNVMQVVTDRQGGLFPSPAEISLDCDCPDGAYMCKHIAAVLYGVAARLDQEPALLFTLRGVNHEELVDVSSQIAAPAGTGRGGSKRLASVDLGDVFGIDLGPDVPAKSTPRGATRVGRARSAKKKSVSIKKKTAKKKSVSTKKKTVKRSRRKNVVRKDEASISGRAPKKKARKPTTKKKTANTSTRRSSRKKAVGDVS